MFARGAVQIWYGIPGHPCRVIPVLHFACAECHLHNDGSTFFGEPYLVDAKTLRQSVEGKVTVLHERKAGLEKEASDEPSASFAGRMPSNPLDCDVYVRQKLKDVQPLRQCLVFWRATTEQLANDNGLSNCASCAIWGGTMNGCSFKKYNPRSVSEEYPEQTVRVRDVCPDPVFLDGRCFTHARIAEQLPQIMDGWKLGKATPFLQHAVTGGT